MNSTRVYIGASLIAFACILFFGMIMPAYDGIKSRREALDQRNQLLAQQLAIVQNLNDLKTKAAQKAADIKQFNYLVPPSKDVANLVEMLQTLAIQNGLEMETLTTGLNLNDNKTVYTIQTIDMTLNGNYPSFRSYIDNIEKNIRIIDINAIDGAPVAENSPIIQFRVKANVYFLQK